MSLARASRESRRERGNLKQAFKIVRALAEIGGHCKSLFQIKRTKH